MISVFQLEIQLVVKNKCLEIVITRRQRIISFFLQIQAEGSSDGHKIGGICEVCMHILSIYLDTITI